MKLAKLSALAVAAALLLPAGAASAATNWYPLDVDVWDPPFNSELKRREDSYTPTDRATKPWKICAAIPHLKDAYWLAVNFALVDEAKRLGVRLRVSEAGGYDKLDIQREQVEACMATGADGLIVSGVTGDGLNDIVERILAEGKPVIDLINWITAKGITARAAVTYFDNGFQAGSFLKQEMAGNPARVLWFPGPKGPGWSALGDEGMQAALKDSGIEIVETAWGDTGRAKQAELIKAALDRHQDIDYVVGTTVSAEAAIDILRERGMSDDVKVMAYYYGPGVHRAIRRGHILAAPTDKQGLQARLAMDIIVRALDGKPYLQHVGPKVEVVERKSLRSFDETSSIPPRGFRPVFSVEDWVNR